MWIGQSLEIGSEKRLRGFGGNQTALHQNRGQRLGDPELGCERARRVGIRVGCENPPGRNHSLAYNNTPQASQPSMVAPRWISALRCVGTAVKQFPHELPCNG